MRLRKFPIPLSILLFIGLTFVGIWYVRKQILEQHMLRAAEMNDEETIVRLASSWPNPARARTKEGVTPLHWVAFEGSQRSAEALLSAGAEVDAIAPDPIGESYEGRGTPLYWAVDHDNRGVAEALIAHGANVNALSESPDPMGVFTPLERGVYMGCAELVSRLLEAGADVHLTGYRSSWPLRHALANDNDIAQMLIDHGADLSRRTEDGETVFHLCAWGLERRGVEVLIRNGADINARDNKGRTPLHLLAGRGSHSSDRVPPEEIRRLFELLITSGADVNARDNDGKTPMVHARENCNGDMVEILRKHGAKE